MNPFQFARVESQAAALQTIGRSGNARYIAGGTNILDLMKDAVEQPSLLVDINPIPLRMIERRGDSLFIGALARMSDVAADRDVKALFPMVASALEQSASPQLRNMASIGGNLMQRTRCPYFRDTATSCNKRVRGSGCGAIAGVNRSQAILGTSEHCIATHASDLAVALRALDTLVHVFGAGGRRDIALADFYRLPGDTPEIETALAPGELIVGMSIALLPFAGGSVYLKVRDRSQYEFALASAAVALQVEDGTIRAARVALGGVGTIPWRSPEAERLLLGSASSRETFERAAAAAIADARGWGENDFKIALAKRTLVRALELGAAKT